MTIPLGAYLASDRFEGPDATRFLVLTVVSTAACALYLWSLKGLGSSTLPYWGFFAIIYIGHYLQYFWLLRGADRYPWLQFIIEHMDKGVLLDAYSEATAALSVAACASAVMLRSPLRRTSSPNTIAMSDAAKVSICRQALCCGVAIATLSAALMYRLNIGVVGLDVNLPYRLAGIILNARRTLAPAFLLLVVVASGKTTRLRKYFWIALVVLFVDAVGDMVVSTSRAPLALIGIRLFTLFVVQHELSGRRIQVIAAAVAGTIVLFPFVGDLRNYRSTGAGVSEAIGWAQSSSADRAPEVGSQFALLSRFSGAIALLPIISSQTQVSASVVIDGIVGGGGGVTGFNTTQIAGYSEGDKMGVAPSLLGWLYLVGGEIGQIVGMAVLVLLTGRLWERLARINFRVRPVAQAVLGGVGFAYLAEGNIEGMMLPLAVGVAASAILEVIVIQVERRTTCGGEWRARLDDPPRGGREAQ